MKKIAAFMVLLMMTTLYGAVGSVDGRPGEWPKPPEPPILPDYMELNYEYEFTTVDESELRCKTEYYSVIRDEKNWTAFWYEHAPWHWRWPEGFFQKSPPEIDFERNMMVNALWGMKRTGGYLMTVTHIYNVKYDVKIPYGETLCDEMLHGNDAIVVYVWKWFMGYPVCMMQTYPHHLVQMEKSNLPVIFMDQYTNEILEIDFQFEPFIIEPA